MGASDFTARFFERDGALQVDEHGIYYGNLTTQYNYTYKVMGRPFKDEVERRNDEAGYGYVSYGHIEKYDINHKSGWTSYTVPEFINDMKKKGKVVSIFNTEKREVKKDI